MFIDFSMLVSSPAVSAFSKSRENLGFKAALTGGHMARSMMLDEITTILTSTPVAASLEDVRRAIATDNILNKPTQSSREKSFDHLRELYGLDSSQALFRVLRRFAAADSASIPIMAAVCSFCRDLQLRASFELIRSLRVGEVLPREQMEEHLEASFPNRFSPAMKKSLAQNVNTSWTGAGHLVGRARKTRAVPAPRPVAAAYAMVAGYLAGLRGQRLLQSRFGEIAVPQPGLLASQLALAAARGLLGFKQAGGVVEFDFSRLLTADERSLADVTD